MSDKPVTNEILHEKLTAIGADVTRLVHAWDGNGEPGAKVRLDRLEQENERRKWWVRSIAVAAFGAAGAVVKGWFSTKG